MSGKNVQFAVAVHMLAVLGYYFGSPLTSAVLAQSVNADPSYIRRTVAKLSKAGLVHTSRGKNGACFLASPPELITFLDIYKASNAPDVFSIYGSSDKSVSFMNEEVKIFLGNILDDAREGLESRLKRRTLAEVVFEMKQRKTILG